ncbi:MAG: alkaline phosphatase family protein, partial [Actinomycetota bacterium]|nr:alkaline phosphatase family protein [Actinomycetota bacterium]
PDHYRLPPAIARTSGLDRDVEELDARDGDVDGAWRGHEILDDVDRLEETPAFIRYHARALMNLIRADGYGDDRVTDLLFTNFKQIDRVGHYFNMASEEVRDSLIETDQQLGRIVEFLDNEVGRGEYVVVVTADHGQQPDADAIDAFGIDPSEVEADIDTEFGPITRAVWPTEVFLLDEEMRERGVTVADVAAFLGDYSLADNASGLSERLQGDGRFDADTRVFEMAIPGNLLPGMSCGARTTSP